MVEPIPLSNSSSIVALILAGGEGRRMGGIDKGLVEWQSQPLIAHQLSAVSRMMLAGGATFPIWVSANRNQSIYQSFTAISGVVSDDTPSFQGPLAGIASMLSVRDWEWLLILPCDMPLLPDDVLTRLWSARVTGGVSVACTGDGVEPKWFPVVSLAHRTAVQRIAARLANQQRSVMGWISEEAYRLVRFEDQQLFANCNDLLSLDLLGV